MTTILPAWKRELIEKKKRKDKEEKQKLQEESARIERIPEWKRTLIQKRGSQSNLLAGGVQQSSNPQNLSNGSVVHTKPCSPASSFSHSEGNSYVIEHTASSKKPYSSIRSQEKVTPKENTNNREKNSLVTTSTCITNSVDSSSLNSNEKPVIVNAPAAEENAFSLRKVGFGKSNGSIVNGMDHGDANCEVREGSAICSDKVEYEHVRPPSELRKMFEKPKAQIVSGDDRSGTSNEITPSYANAKNNKETVSFKSSDVDRPATQINQNRFEGSARTADKKFVEHKVPNSLQTSPKDSKQPENDYRTSGNTNSVTVPTENRDSKALEKSKHVSALSTNVVTGSAVNTSTKAYPSHFAPKPYKAYSSSARFPWMKSSSEVDKSKPVGKRSPASLSTDTKSDDVVAGTCKSEIGGDRMGVSTCHSTHGHSTQPPENSVSLECKEKQDMTGVVDSQSEKSQGAALTGSDGFKQKFVIESKTENYITSQNESIPQTKDKFKDSAKRGGFDPLDSKFDHGNHISNDTTLSWPIRDSGKVQSRPPSVHKRWSADVATMLSLQNQKTEPARHRSPSLGEVSEETCDWSHLFRHRPSISEGIERRMSELKRQVSHSEDGENQEEISNQSKPVELMVENSDHKQQKSIRARPLSWAAPGDITLHSGGAQNVEDVHHSPKEKVFSDKTVPFAHKPVGQSIERRVGELVRHSSTPDLLAALKDSERQALGMMEPGPTASEKIQSDVFDKMKEKPSSIRTATDKAEERVIDEDIVKPSKGSVHKLSALFGSSIFRGNKKDKPQTESKSETLKSHKIEKPEKVNKNVTQNKEEANSSPSLFKKVFKTENRTKNVENNAKELEGKAESSKLSSSDKVGINKKVPSISRESEEPVNKRWPANELRHVQTQEKKKVEKKLAGKLVLVVDEDADDLRSGYFQRSDSGSSKSIHTRVIDFEKDENSDQSVAHQSDNQSLNKDKSTNPNTFLAMNGIVDPTYDSSASGPTDHNSQTDSISSIHIPESMQSDVSVSVIDMPEQSDNDVEVSIIDVPRSPIPLDVEVSAIDLPEAPEVSVIDMPGPEETKVASHSLHQLHVYDISDGSDDSDSDGELSGSYDITVDVEDNEPFIITEGKSFGDDDDGSIYDTYPPKVPEVVFDVAPPSDLKSCICHKSGRKQVSFRYCLTLSAPASLSACIFSLHYPHKISSLLMRIKHLSYTNFLS